MMGFRARVLDTKGVEHNQEAEPKEVKTNEKYMRHHVTHVTCLSLESATARGDVCGQGEARL